MMSGVRAVFRMCRVLFLLGFLLGADAVEVLLLGGEEGGEVSKGGIVDRVDGQVETRQAPRTGAITEPCFASIRPRSPVLIIRYLRLHNLVRTEPTLVALVRSPPSLSFSRRLSFSGRIWHG